MNTRTKWGIGVGVGIPCVLILIGLIAFVIKFFMKRCRTRAWIDINSLPKQIDSSENSTTRRPIRRLSSEREPLYSSTTNNVLEVHDGHVAIPIGENDLSPAQLERAKQHEQTLVQIQRDRLNRLKEEENRLRPMIHSNHGEDDIQHVIDLAQKEFEESV